MQTSRRSPSAESTRALARGGPIGGGPGRGGLGRGRLLRGGLLLAVLTLAAGACRDAAEPVPSEARSATATEIYPLRHVMGDALPAVGVEHQHLRLTLIADTLHLSPDGNGIRRTIEHTVSSSALPPGEATHDRREHFTWRLEGARFTAELACPAFASCVAPPHLVGTLADDALTLEYALYLRVPLSYTRVR